MQSQQVHSIVGAGDKDGTPLRALEGASVEGALVDLGTFEPSAAGDLVGHLEGLRVDLGVSRPCASTKRIAEAMKMPDRNKDAEKGFMTVKWSNQCSIKGVIKWKMLPCIQSNQEIMV